MGCQILVGGGRDEVAAAAHAAVAVAHVCAVRGKGRTWVGRWSNCVIEEHAVAQHVLFQVSSLA